MGDPGAGQAPSYSATTDFESKSHEELLRMVRDANSERVSQLGQTLVDAGADLDQIGSDLKRDMGALLWEGKAGDAFRAWGHKVAIAAEYLSDYSDTAGRFMKDAGATLADVKSAMPEVPTESKRIADAYAPGMSEEESMAKLGYCPSPEAVTRAKQDTTDAHAEAVRQMTKLGQAYNMSREIISDLEPPEIPPVPSTSIPSDLGQGNESNLYDVGTSRTSSGSDSIRTTVPDRESVPTSSVIDAGRSSGVGANHQSLPLARESEGAFQSAPAESHLSALAPELTQTDSVDLLPVDTNPVSPRLPGTGQTAGEIVNAPVPANSTFSPGLPLPSAGGTTGGALPRSGNGMALPLTREGPGSATKPRLPLVNGIHGGISSPIPAPANQIPRGVVVGAERGTTSHFGRPPVSGMGNAVGAEQPRPQNRAPRVASEPGGVVGAPRASTLGARDAFTSGGSGLVSRGDQGVRPTSGNAGGTPKPDEDARRRQRRLPDNLVEDENVWSRAAGRTVPPVIE